MGMLAIVVVLIGSLAFFLFGLVARIVLRNEGRHYTDACNRIMQVAALAPVLYGALVLLIGLAPLN